MRRAGAAGTLMQYIHSSCGRSVCSMYAGVLADKLTCCRGPST
jgi:hypothetical protein